jgi:hypothetical protein
VSATSKPDEHQKKCSETVAHAEQLIQQAKRYVEQSKELVVATLPKKKRFG